MCLWVCVCALPAFGRSVPALVSGGDPLACTHSLWQRGPELLCMLQLLLHVAHLHKGRRGTTQVKNKSLGLEAPFISSWSSGLFQHYSPNGRDWCLPRWLALCRECTAGNGLQRWSPSGSARTGRPCLVLVDHIHGRPEGTTGLSDFSSKGHL